MVHIGCCVAERGTFILRIAARPFVTTTFLALVAATTVSVLFSSWSEPINLSPRGIPMTRFLFLSLSFALASYLPIKTPDAKDAHQPKPKPKAILPPPTFENVKYGPHE